MTLRLLWDRIGSGPAQPWSRRPRLRLPQSPESRVVPSRAFLSIRFRLPSGVSAFHGMMRRVNESVSLLSKDWLSSWNPHRPAEPLSRSLPCGQSRVSPESWLLDALTAKCSSPCQLRLLLPDSFVGQFRILQFNLELPPSSKQ